MLADRQGLLKGDLDSCQRSLLSYLVFREMREDRERDLDHFKEMLVAAHPERADAILGDFKDKADLAPQLSDEELEFEPRYTSDEIEAAHDIFSKLFEKGGAVIPYD